MGLFKRSGVVGLELDTGVIRAVELRGKPGKARLAAVGMVEIPEDVVVEGNVVNTGEVTEALNRLWSEAGFGSRDVVLGTFNQGVMTRMINFPKIAESKLSQAIRLQAQEYFPIPLSQMVLDFAVVGEVKRENGSELEVLLVAAKSSALEKSIASLQGSKLIPRVVDASPLALLRVLPGDIKAEKMAMVDIANGLSSLLMVVRGTPRFARVIPVSLKQYAAQLGLEVKEVLSPVSLAGESERYVAAGEDSSRALQKWARAAAEEIRSTINYFIKLDNLTGVDALVLSGRGARLAGLPELLQEELGMAVAVASPLGCLEASGKKNTDFAAAQPDFAVCTGLALRGLEG